MSDTPRTDANWRYPASFDASTKVIRADLACQLERENAALRAERLELMEQFAQELSVTDFEKRPWLTESAGSTLCADMLKQLAEAGRFRIVRDEDTWVQGYWTKNDQQKKEVK